MGGTTSTAAVREPARGLHIDGFVARGRRQTELKGCSERGCRARPSRFTTCSLRSLGGLALLSGPQPPPTAHTLRTVIVLPLRGIWTLRIELGTKQGLDEKMMAMRRDGQYGQG